MTDKKRFGRWKPGESGNPGGRPTGSGDVAKLREGISMHVPDIVAKLVGAAKAGDVGAARLLLERAIPPIKAVDLPAPLQLLGDTLAQHGQAILFAAGSGHLTPSQAAQLMSGLGALARVIETDELAARVAALEEKHGNKH